MNCRDCEEMIAAAARDGRTLEGAAEHIARCGRCREFAQDAAVVAFSLVRWYAPGALEQEADAAYAALLRRMAPPGRHGGGRRWGVTTASGPGLKPRSVPDESRCRGLGRQTHAGGACSGTARGFNPGRPALPQPAWLAVPGITLAAAGISMAPAWVQFGVACWAAVSVVLVSLVLLAHSQPVGLEGE